MAYRLIDFDNEMPPTHTRHQDGSRVQRFEPIPQTRASSFPRSASSRRPGFILAELPWTITNAGEWIKAQAGGIGLADGKGSQEASNIEAALSKAKQIFSLGFSFTDTNTQLLGLTDKHGPRLFVQNFGKDQRVARTLYRLRAAATEAGSIPQLVRNGFFEQEGP